MNEAAREAERKALGMWQELQGACGDFDEHVERLAVGSGDLELYGHELYLACACAGGHAAALRILEREYLGATARVIARVNNASDFVEEMQQVLRERLLVGPEPRIGQYAATGSLKAWLRVSALRVALNHTKTKGSEELLVDAIVELPASDPRERERYREPVQAALRSAFADLSARQRNILRLHYVKALSIDQIGALYGAHRATAARWLNRAREQIFEQVTQRVREALGLTVSEVRSVLVQVRSQLDISVVRLLGDQQESEPAADG
jgi:RNA polymerase sigma-70 factor, ECF subfamily